MRCDFYRQRHPRPFAALKLTTDELSCQPGRIVIVGWSSTAPPGHKKQKSNFGSGLQLTPVSVHRNPSNPRDCHKLHRTRRSVKCVKAQRARSSTRQFATFSTSHNYSVGSCETEFQPPTPFTVNNRSNCLFALNYPAENDSFGRGVQLPANSV